MNKSIIGVVILVSAHIFAGEVLASTELPQFKSNELHIPTTIPNRKGPNQELYTNFLINNAE